MVRGLGPRLPLRRRSPWSTRSSPRSSSGCCSSSSSSTRTARSPPTSGSSPTSTRRCTPGPSGASTTWTASATARRDREFLEKCFHKLLINFAWWVNKVDREGNNVFEGGFLGLDNITVIDRSEPLPAGAVLEQSDATGWMGMFCLNLMRIALELAKENHAYEALATKFFQHYIYVGAAMKKMGGRGYSLWDEEDGFFYDVLTLPGRQLREVPRALAGRPDPALRGRAAGGALDRAASTSSASNLYWFLENKQHIVQDVCHPVVKDGERHARAAPSSTRARSRACCARILDPDEFLSPCGLRSLSQYHEQHPFVFGDRAVELRAGGGGLEDQGRQLELARPGLVPDDVPDDRVAAQARQGLRADVHGRPPTAATGPQRTLVEMARGHGRPPDPHLHARRRTAAGPSTATRRKFQDDPHWRDLILFYEYFHGDTGEGLGASHQTGWTGLVASLIDEWRRRSALVAARGRSRRGADPGAYGSTSITVIVFDWMLSSVE